MDRHGRHSPPGRGEGYRCLQKLPGLPPIGAFSYMTRSTPVTDADVRVRRVVQAPVLRRHLRASPGRTTHGDSEVRPAELGLQSPPACRCSPCAGVIGASVLRTSFYRARPTELVGLPHVLQSSACKARPAELGQPLRTTYLRSE